MNKHIFTMIEQYAGALSGISEEPVKIMVFQDGQIYENENGRSYPIERKLLAEESAIQAVVLSRTPFCTKVSESGGNLLPSLDDMAQIVGPVAETVPYEEGAVRCALETSACCFIGGRYTISAGRSLFEAATALEVLEKAAEVSLKAEVLGGPAPVCRQEAAAMRENYLRHYSRAEAAVKAEEEKSGGTCGGSDTFRHGQGQESEWTPAEQQIRSVLAEFGRKVVEAGLVQGTWGNLSARLDSRYMIVTPSGLDYTRLTPSDMVKVEIASLNYEGDLKPTSEKGIHGGIYEKRPDVGAVIHTHSKYCAVFAAAGKAVPVGSEAEKRVFGDAVKMADYAPPGSEELWSNTISALGDNQGCIMANHGMLCVGADLAEAFENCKVLEHYCKTYINSRYKEGN